MKIRTKVRAGRDCGGGTVTGPAHPPVITGGGGIGRPPIQI